MSEKPETRFSRRLHHLLDPRVYVEKMANPYRSATPDFYYEGNKGILWAEHKWIKAPWTEDVAAKDLCKTKSWPLQLQWLLRAANNNQEALVIVGTPKLVAVIIPPFDFVVKHHLFRPLDWATWNIEKSTVWPLEIRSDTPY